MFALYLTPTTFVRVRNEDHIPSLLGRAQIFYQKNNFAEALKLYKKVLQINPSAPANVRLGFAHCFYQLNRLDVREDVVVRC
jgi:RNA polymerase-associated protein CTR9